MAILGLIGTEQFAEERFTSIRRSVFYEYPNGSAPLLGLLSMLDGEVLHDPEFSWYEKRLKEMVTDTTKSNYWYADNGGSVGTIMGAAGSDREAGTAYWIQVVDPTVFTARAVFRITDVETDGGDPVEVQFKVKPNASGEFVQDNAGQSHVRVTPMNTVADVSNPAGEPVKAAQVFGTANEQGQVGADEAQYNLPTATGNAAQIFRTTFTFTNTAIKTSAKFDESGPYKDKAKEASMNHMIGMELQFLFGDYSKSVDTTTNLPTYTTGGILFFLKLWEKGQGGTYAGVTNTYGNRAATENDDDNKRIININGSLSMSDLDDYYERLFRHTNNISNEKMAFVGSGFLNVINKLYKSSVEMNVNVPHSDTYGMKIVEHITPFGTVYYKTHPLFNRSAILRNNALFLDVQNLKYRYIDGRDTDLIDNVQPNNADYRQDELRSECGLELQFPEANLYMVGVTDIA